MKTAQLPTTLQQVIHQSRYARWDDEKSRRETWQETVDRYVKFMFDDHLKGKLGIETRDEIRNAIYNLEVMPSMRCLMTAGPALEKNHIAAFNCASSAINNPAVFSEMLLILMNGCGFGFSVERQFVSEMPLVPEVMRPSKSVIVVEDSKEGWQQALAEMIGSLYAGSIPKWDLSKVRPAGSKLRTFGGRASGPEPLDELFKFCVKTFKNAEGRKLNSLECHDICCKIAECVVSGGVRRSATISLSNPSDDRMRHAKSGDWWNTDPHRAMSNNSAIHTEKPDMGSFMREWIALYESKSGERGIVNRESFKKQAALFKMRDPNHDFLVNPCGEIVLRSSQFCNLSEVIVRPNDDAKSLKRKVRLATILGTIQASLTDVKNLRRIWKKNTQEEALLGISMTGIFDNNITNGVDGKAQLATLLEDLRDHTIKVNKEYSTKIGINQSVALTCVKPSGTCSLLVNSASGIHPRFSKFYARRIRFDKKDPLVRVIAESGIPYEDDVTKPEHQVVFTFPVKSPEQSVVQNSISAIDQLEMWKIYKKHWCHHNPSVTIYVRESEWMEVGSWVWKNWDWIGGLSFLPASGSVYKQMPFEEVDAETYKKMESVMPKEINWAKLSEYEKDDKAVVATKEYACTGGSCELA